MLAILWAYVFSENSISGIYYQLVSNIYRELILYHL